MLQNQNSTKSVTVCIVGAPNSGKSTLINNIIGKKISIVTPKINTTRSIITGVLTLDNIQVVLFDTPGISLKKTEKEISSIIIKSTWSRIYNVDIVAIIIDGSKRIDNLDIQLFNKIRELNQNTIVLINKIDLGSKFKNYNKVSILKSFNINFIFEISALLGKNISKLLSFIKSHAQESSWMYKDNDVTNSKLQFLASEITREQLLLKLNSELPYKLAVKSEHWCEKKGKVIRIYQNIIVPRESHKVIILGKNGCMIKEIGFQSRIEMEKVFNCKIHLFLYVKVRKVLHNTLAEYIYYDGKFNTNSRF